MRRGPSEVTIDSFKRTVEYLDGAPGLSRIVSGVNFGIKFEKFFSFISPIHHFSSITEFWKNQSGLKEGNRVAFEEVTVDDCTFENGTLNLTFRDGNVAAY